MQYDFQGDTNIIGLLWGHSQLCSWLILDSVLSDYSCQCSRHAHLVPGSYGGWLHARLAEQRLPGMELCKCKVGAFLPVPSLGTLVYFPVPHCRTTPRVAVPPSLLAHPCVSPQCPVMMTSRIASCCSPHRTVSGTVSSNARSS